MVNTLERRQIYGLTGEVDRDGFLTPDQAIHLHHIQVASAASCMDYLDQKRPTDPFPLVAMATGIGKGKIIHHVIESQLRKKPDSKILVVVGTKLVLVDQTHAALSDYQNYYDIPAIEEWFYGEWQDTEDIDEMEETLDEDSSIEDQLAEEQSFLYKTGKIGDEDANVHVAVIQKVQSEIRLQTIDPKEYDLVIVDEVHNIGTEKRKETIHEFDRVVGFTATPVRSSGDMRTPDEYGFSVISPLSLKEAQGLGFLPPLVGMQYDTSSVIEKIPMRRDGKINYSKLERALKESPDLRPYIADRVTEVIGGENKYKTIMVVNFIWEAQELAKLLKERGISVGIAVNRQAAREIHTDEIPAIDSIQRYKFPREDENSVQVLISPYVAAEGFDAPFTEVLVWASPTNSALRYTQYTGRLTRRAEGKQFGILIDFLYQTSQYNWSYNLGMWMKGDVEQLDNGLLWLGSATSIDEIKNLPEIQRMLDKSAKESLSSLQSDEFFPLSDTDFSLAPSHIKKKFHGVAKRNEEIAWSVARELQARDPNLVTKRIGTRNRIVDAVTDGALFLQLMEARGVPLREVNLREVQPNDIVLTDKTIPELLEGDPQNIYPVLKKVLAELRVSSPDSVARRKKGNHFVNVVFDEDVFYKAMADNGVRRKDKWMQELQPGEFVVGQENLSSLFVGEYRKISEIASDVLDYFRAVLPDLVEKRKSGSRFVDIVHDPLFFVGAMILAGARLKDTELQDAQEGDFPITQLGLKTTFAGKYSKLDTMAKEVIKSAADEGLAVTKLRKRSTRVISVVPKEHEEWFKAEMVKRGATLREASAEGSSEAEELFAEEVDPEMDDSTKDAEVSDNGDTNDFEETFIPDAASVLATLQENADTLRDAGIEVPPVMDNTPLGELLSQPLGPFELQRRRMSEYHRHIFSNNTHQRIDSFIDGHEGNFTLSNVLELTGNSTSLKTRLLVRRFINENNADAKNLTEDIFRDLVAVLGFNSEN